MKRGKFLKLLGIGVAAIPAAKLIGLPKDEDGFWIDKPVAAPFKAPVVKTAPVDLGANPILDRMLDDNIYVSLFTENPDDSKGEIYKNYKRVGVPRNQDNWKITKRTASNKKEIMFPECTGKGCVVRGFWIEDKNRNVIFEGSLSQDLYIDRHVTPCFTAGSLQITID